MGVRYSTDAANPQKQRELAARLRFQDINQADKDRAAEMAQQREARIAAEQAAKQPIEKRKLELEEVRTKIAAHRALLDGSKMDLDYEKERANYMKALVARAKERQAEIDVPNIGIELLHLRADDPDYAMKVNLLRTKYQYGAATNAGKAAIDTALKDAQESIKDFEHFGSVLGYDAIRKAPYVVRDANGNFVSSNMMMMKHDAKVAEQKEQIRLNPNSALAWNAKGQMTATEKAQKELDVSGIAMTPAIQGRVSAAGKKARTDVLSMIANPSLPILPGYEDSAGRIKAMRSMTPEEIEQQLDGFAHQAMQQELTNARSQQTQDIRKAPQQTSRLKAQLSNLDKLDKKYSSLSADFDAAAKKAGKSTADYVSEKQNEIEAQRQQIQTHLENHGTDDNAHQSGIVLPDAPATEIAKPDTTSAIWGSDAPKATEARKVALPVKSKAPKLMPKWAQPSTESDVTKKAKEGAKTINLAESISALKKHASFDPEKAYASIIGETETPESLGRLAGFMGVDFGPDIAKAKETVKQTIKSDALARYNSALANFHDAASSAGLHPDVADQVAQHLTEGNDVTLQDLNGVPTPHVTTDGVTVPILPPTESPKIVESAADVQ